ncbi:PRD domain-containing protein [Erysipelotrichaceae bacterium AF15-26LB]|nr:PRD domain protein [Erysipelotrichaceae bacterium 3_1_53]MCR0329412.1 PRD domain-containing protein [[Clostridium] innocuum]MCR0348559.1 PRD domain-containing protein [[Clostridium] innocuum]RJV88447.1 PRD domain-containing protein [Erysipelotrichaceae bacterium AF19-24AC]RJV90237.1 PRD domain-containing protein [Erysipelotrichaceae bacterium AF15-26LB]
MYTVMKALNNNSVLVQDDTGTSMIFLGKGIGFGKKNGDSIACGAGVEVYRFTETNDHGDAMEIIQGVNPLFIEVAGKILKLAQIRFHEVDKNILLPLADHIAFSIERMKADMDISNPFASEIALLYKEEYEVALQGKAIIEEMCGYTINEGEVGYITLHVHSARGEDKVSEAMQTAVIIRDSIEEVERDYNITINTNSMSYTRLMNHMKFLMLRLQGNEELQIDVGDYVSKQFPYAYHTAQKICEELRKVYQKDVPETEIGYLALHIERVRTSELQEDKASA